MIYKQHTNMKEVAIGIDIGGTNSVLGVIDRNGNCLAESAIPTQTHSEIEAFLQVVAKEVNRMLGTLKDNVLVKGMGIGAPNGNYYLGTIEYAPNLIWKGVIPLVDLVKQYFDFPTIVLTNDANAAAIGEMMYGGARGMNDFIMITLGTGVGSGIVVNGSLIYGHDGFAGEIGHILVDPMGRECGCGRRGCLETYASAPGIKRTVFELLADTSQPSRLRGIAYNKMNAKTIHDAAKHDDKIALDAFDFTGEILGKVLADCVAFSSPEAIFLFGGLANAGDFIFKPTKHYLEENLLKIYKNKVKLLPSELDGAHAAILGASALVWKEEEKQLQ
jgi:glucokinase